MIEMKRAFLACLFYVFLLTRGAALSLKAVNANRSLVHCVETYASGLENVKKGSAEGLVEYIHYSQVANVSLRNITFGVGAGSTGSSSLAAAFMEMGFKTANGFECGRNKAWNSALRQCIVGNCYACYRNFDYTLLPDELEVVLDDPVGYNFINIFSSFPNAKWILHKRPSHKWAEDRLKNWRISGLSEISRVIISAPREMPCHNWGGDSLSFFSAPQLARLMELHDDLVRCAVKPEKLFEFDLFVNGTEGLMHDLGVFMEMPLPPSKKHPYPHVKNTDLHKLESCIGPEESKY